MEVTRRDLFKFTGLAAAGVVGASALAGCAPKTAAETASLADTGSADAGLPAFLQAPEPITDFADTREYDVVVVGAGESGLSAAHSAVAAGGQGSLRPEHRNRPDHGQHGRLGGHHQDRRGRHPGLRRLPHGEERLPLEPQAAGSMGPQLL